jgi:hypothetical protein
VPQESSELKLRMEDSHLSGQLPLVATPYRHLSVRESQCRSSTCP